jgi:hypothetical protein
MAGDFSRSTVNPVMHYAGVLMQQGRVQVDADWNEQLALQLYRTWTETVDLIGRCGTPKSGSGFAISATDNGADLLIHPGRYYVNGLLCELDPQKIPAWLASASIPPPNANVIYRLTSGESVASMRYKLERLAAKPTGTKIFAPELNQIYIPSLTIDGRELAVGDRVEISGDGKSVIGQVTAIGDAVAPADPNIIVPSWYPVNIDRPLFSLADSSRLSLRRVVTFTTQPFLTNQWDQSVETSPLSDPSIAALNLPDGDYLVVLEAWQREIDALQDPHIREVALGGPDTCERLQTVWQVHVLPWSGESSPPGSPLPSPLPAPPSPPNCCSDFPSYDDYRASTRTTGLMNAQAPPPGSNVPPCQLPPSAGYLGLANQLYRVEIFQPGRYNEAATFVWSRDNAMVETPIVCLDSSGNVYVSSLGTDDLHSFDLNDWVEIVDDDADLQGQPRFLAQISQPPGAAAQPPCASAGVQAYCLNLQPSAPARFQNLTNLRLRRWDMPSSAVALDASLNPIGIPIAPGWIQLENNIQVNFSDGHYATGSYWQIPARTATGDIEWPPFEVPNTNPIPQPPIGPDHFFCRLALLTVTDGKIHVTDCRCTFPSLTTICADDICCQSSGCVLSPVGTVQQALEELEAKHRLHNRTLHGSGVVCGLAVTCPGANLTGSSVRIADGYAIDCEGYDLILSKPTSVDLASLVALSPQQATIPDGEYELIIERATNDRLIGSKSSPLGSSSDPCCSKTVPATNPADQCVSFQVIPCEKEKSLSAQILDGTLLMDFYTRCLKPLIDNFKSEYTNAWLTPDDLVSDSQALLSALTNLIIQYIQPSLTADVYISADEAARLENFYNFITAYINDCTYCSLLTGASFPAYPLSAPITTIYGKGFKTRLRVDPTGKVAVACGSGPDVQIFDLTSGALVAVITPPIPGTPTGWTLQDVAFSADGSQIYVIATGVNTQTNASDSFFAAGTLSGKKINWTVQGSAGPQPYLTLALSSQQQNVVYATVQGAGIYTISFSGGITATPMAQFSAIGHLVASGGFLYATASLVDANNDTIYEVLCYQPGAEEPRLTSPVDGLTIDLTDDLAVGNFSLAAGAKSTVAFVSGLSSTSGTKKVALFNASEKGQQVGQTIDLGANTTIRMALQPSVSSLFVTYESTSSLATITAGANEPTLTIKYAPVELNPTSVAFGVLNNTTTLYTLNSTANTISTMPGSMAAFSAYSALEQYRVAALGALTDLAGAFLQYLKDCFCKLLLPACSTCSDDAREGKGVPLACITVQDGTVQRICNLEKRRIVKSFPTVGYWLSLIPVIPLVKVLIQSFCCSDLASAFSRINVPGATKEKNPANITKGVNFSSLFSTPDFSSLSGEHIRYALTQAGKIDLASAPTNLLLQSVPIGQLTLDSALNHFRQPSAATSAVAIAKINGMSLVQAKSVLQAANVQVAATEAYNPATFAQNVGDYVSSPASVPPGSSVTLVVDSNNTVRYYVPTAPAVQQLSSTVQASQASIETQIKAANQATQQLQTRVAAIETSETPTLQNIQSLQNLVSGLQTQIATLQSSQATALAQRDQEIAQLTATTQQMQTKLAKIDTLSTQVQSIEQRLPPAAKS